MTQYPSGRLIVERLPGAQGQPLPHGDDETPLPFARVRLRVTAEAIPLSRFGAALAAAVQFGVVVSPNAFDFQVSMAWEDVTAERVLAGLRSIGIAHRVDNNQASITLYDPSFDVELRTPGFHCTEVPETRILPLPPRVPAAEVARYFCERLATDRGYADVIAGRLVLHDVSASLNQIEMFVRGLSDGAAQVHY